MTSHIFRCAASSAVWASTCVMPSTPFIGVRISWLIVARKVDLARLACSAAQRADRWAASACI